MSRSLPLALLAFLLAFQVSAPSANAQTAFRFTDLDLRDPHTYVSLPFLGCRDITDSVPLGLGTPFNGSLQESIELDKNGDGSLDLNALIFFLQEDVVVGTNVFLDGTQWDPADAVGNCVFHFGLCSPPFASPVCVPDVAQPIDFLDYANETVGNCLDAVPSTLNSMYTAPTFPAGPCFFGEPFDMVFNVGGIPVPLDDVQLGATYLDTIPPRLVDGIVRGFLVEAAADSVIIPEATALVGGQPLSALLPGGTGNCASHDDRDTHLGQSGWWIYFDFEADEVPFTPSTDVPLVAVGKPGPESLRVFPNPSSENVLFSVRIPADATGARLDVMDVRGARVRSLGSQVVPGRRDFSWDGTDSRGRPLPAGVYFARLETSSGAITKKIVRTR